MIIGVQIGNRYGRLVVISFEGRDISHHKRFKCACDCGGEKIVLAGNLKTGATKSCGCYLREIVPHNGFKQGRRGKFPFGVSARTDLFKRLRHSAKQRGLCMSLTWDVFVKLSDGNCAYCGISPLQCHKTQYGDAILYNGIDRVNSSEGYTAENTVSCCKVCNRAKGNLSVNDFLLWLNRASGYQKIKL